MLDSIGSSLLSPLATQTKTQSSQTSERTLADETAAATDTVTSGSVSQTSATTGVTEASGGSRQAGIASGAAEATPRTKQPAAVIDLSADAGDRAAEADARAAAERMQEQIKRDLLVQSVAAKSGAASSSLLSPTEKGSDTPLSQMSQRADEAYVAAAAATGPRAEGAAAQGVDKRL